MKKFAAFCAVVLVLAMTVQAEAGCRRCRKCKGCAVAVQPTDACQTAQ
jgi:hypothetical protein